MDVEGTAVDNFSFVVNVGTADVQVAAVGDLSLVLNVDTVDVEVTSSEKTPFEADDGAVDEDVAATAPCWLTSSSAGTAVCLNSPFNEVGGRSGCFADFPAFQL